MEQDCQRFEQFLSRRYSRSSTLKHYRSDLKLFREQVGGRAAHEITAADIDRFVDRQIADGLSPATVNRRLASLHSLFEYLASETPDVHWPNPVIPARHRLKLGTYLPRDIAESHVSQLFSVIDDPRDRAMFGVMIGAGLRVGEVVVLQISDLELPTTSEAMSRMRVLGKGSKERFVWITASLLELLRAWLLIRPRVRHDTLFLNQHGRSMSVSGVEYRLKKHASAAGLTLSCHQLRHTFARRLAEHGLPVDSLARLMGHNHLQTTQRYISGADITVRADFARAMQQLELNVLQTPTPRLEIRETLQQPYPQIGSQEDLQRLLLFMSNFPAWLGDSFKQYLCWRWSTWRADAAFETGYNLVRAVTRIWRWMSANRFIANWESFRRSDLETWLVARNQDGVSQRTIRAELIQLRMLLRFLSDRDYPIDPGLFRVQIPRVDQRLLPRYLPEADYQHLERFVLEQTSTETYQASLDRATFLLLAHTGMRISELVHLRLGDVHLPRGVITIRQGKRNRDRTVYTTPLLNSALKRYLIKRHPVAIYDHLLISRLYKPPKDTGVRKRISFYGEQIGLHVTPHQLRHTLATRLLNRGMPIYSLQRLLGHEDLNTTQLYAKVYDETLYHQFQKAMDQVETMAVSTWPIPQSSELDCLLLDDSV